MQAPLPKLKAIDSNPSPPNQVDSRFQRQRKQAMPGVKPPKQPMPEDQTKHKKLTSSTVRITDLPEFTTLDDRWKRLFLPTLAYLLHTSKDPFGGFSMSSDQCTRYVQQAVELVYPDVTYKVSKTNDAVYLMVRRHQFLGLLVLRLASVRLTTASTIGGHSLQRRRLQLSRRMSVL